MSNLQPSDSDGFLAFLEELAEDICLPSQSGNSSLRNNHALLPLAQPNVVTQTKRNRRRSSSGTKVLETQLKEKEAQLKELLIDNIYLVERNRMIDNLLACKEKHAARLTNVREGSLSFNPFAFWQTTVAEFPSICTPPWFGSKLADIGEKCAVLLASATPLLTKHPELASKDAWQFPYIGAEPQLLLSVSFQEGSVEEQQLEALKQLVLYVQKIRAGYDHGLLMCPKALFVDGAHVQLFQLNNISTWEAFAQARASKSNPAAVYPASDEHWSRVVEQCKLSDLQRLGAFVLWELVTTAKKSIAARRTAMFAALTQLRQTDTQRSSVLSITSDKAVVWMDPDVLDKEQSCLRQIETVNEQEKDLFHMVGDTFLWHLLSPVQVAVLTVAGFPYVADVIALTRAAAMECTKEVMVRLAEQSAASGK